MITLSDGACLPFIDFCLQTRLVFQVSLDVQFYILTFDSFDSLVKVQNRKMILRLLLICLVEVLKMFWLCWQINNSWEVFDFFKSTGIGVCLYNLCMYIHTTGMRNFRIPRNFVETNVISRFASLGKS